MVRFSGGGAIRLVFGLFAAWLEWSLLCCVFIPAPVMLKLRSGRLMDTFGIETKNENKPHAAGTRHGPVEDPTSVVIPAGGIVD